MNNQQPVITVRGKMLRDPEMRFSAKGQPITTFSLALYTGGSKEHGYEPSLFVKISAWDDLANFANTIQKMSNVRVEGTPRPKRMYKNQEGVEIQADLEITASKIELVE